MADEQELADQNDGANQETPENEGQEVVMGAEMLEYIQSRKGELDFEESDGEEPSEQEVAGEEVAEAPAQEAKAEDKAEEQAPAESASRTARRALQKEKKLRSEREQFSAEQEGWRTEQAETLAKITAFEESRAGLDTDPYTHLSSNGMSDEQMMDLAREIYYKNMPEQATPAVQAEMAAIQRERRLKKLEAQGLAKDEPEAKPAGPTPEYQAYEAQYRQGLNSFAANVDAEEFPLSSAYAKTDFNDLVQGMFNAAAQSAQNRNGQGNDLTPNECMAAVEDFLRAQQPATTPAPVATPTQTEEPAEQTRTATLRNKTTAAVPNEKHEDDLSYEELRERSRERFDAKMRENQMIR